MCLARPTRSSQNGPRKILEVPSELKGRGGGLPPQSQGLLATAPTPPPLPPSPQRQRRQQSELPSPGQSRLPRTATRKEPYPAELKIQTTQTAQATQATQTQKAKVRRARRTQKPGLTANKNERIFVQHNYHDHADDVDSEDDEQEKSSFSSSSSAVQPLASARRRAKADAKAAALLASASGGGRNNSSSSDVTFTVKLHRLLAEVDENSESGGDEEARRIISWCPHGRAFLIRDPKRFVSDVMTKHFRQSKITSFQRQLNLYGFQRVTRGPDNGAYYHEFFLRGKEFLTRKIKRVRVKGTKYKAASSPDSEPDFYGMPPVGVGKGVGGGVRPAGANVVGAGVAGAVGPSSQPTTASQREDAIGEKDDEEMAESSSSSCASFASAVMCRDNNRDGEDLASSEDRCAPIKSLSPPASATNGSNNDMLLHSFIDHLQLPTPSNSNAATPPLSRDNGSGSDNHIGFGGEGEGEEKERASHEAVVFTAVGRKCPPLLPPPAVLGSPSRYNAAPAPAAPKSCPAEPPSPTSQFSCPHKRLFAYGQRPAPAPPAPASATRSYGSYAFNDPSQFQPARARHRGHVAPEAAPLPWTAEAANTENAVSGSLIEEPAAMPASMTTTGGTTPPVIPPGPTVTPEGGGSGSDNNCDYDDSSFEEARASSTAAATGPARPPPSSPFTPPGGGGGVHHYQRHHHRSPPLLWSSVHPPGGGGSPEDTRAAFRRMAREQMESLVSPGSFRARTPHSEEDTTRATFRRMAQEQMESLVHPSPKARAAPSFTRREGEDFEAATAFKHVSRGRIEALRGIAAAPAQGRHLNHRLPAPPPQQQERHHHSVPLQPRQRLHHPNHLPPPPPPPLTSHCNLPPVSPIAPLPLPPFSSSLNGRGGEAGISSSCSPGKAEEGEEETATDDLLLSFAHEWAPTTTTTSEEESGGGAPPDMESISDDAGNDDESSDASSSLKNGNVTVPDDDDVGFELGDLDYWPASSSTAQDDVELGRLIERMLET